MGRIVDGFCGECGNMVSGDENEQQQEDKVERWIRDISDVIA